MKFQVVRGIVPIGLGLEGRYGEPAIPLPPDLEYQVILHRPDGQGRDVQTPLSGILTGPQQVPWDTREVPDGQYAVSIRVYDSGASSGSDPSRFVFLPTILEVNNIPGPVVGPRYLASVGTAGQRARWQETMAPAWIPIPATGVPGLHPEHPLVHKPVPPLGADQEREDVLLDEELFTEIWIGPPAVSRYDPTELVVQDKEGHLFIQQSNWRQSDSTKDTWRYPMTDGGRENARVNKGSSIRPDPTGPGFLFLGPEGRFAKLDPPSADPAKPVVTTIAGYVTPSDAIPYSADDQRVTLADVNRTRQLRGLFPDGVWDFPQDFAVDGKKVYVADTQNNRIGLLDLSGPVPVYTAFAGKPKTKGFQDGSRSEALFDHPNSVEIIGRTLYVADTGNNAIRAINLDSGEVTTVVLDISEPLWIRQDSKGNLLFTHEGAKDLSRIRLPEGTIELIRHAPSKVPASKYFTVDTKGLFGPVDGVIMAGPGTEADPNNPSLRGNDNPSDHNMGWISPDGQVARQILGDELDIRIGDGRIASAGEGGAYKLRFALDDENSGLLLLGGQYQTGAFYVRPAQAGDPSAEKIDRNLLSEGRDIWFAGTVTEFFNDDAASLRPSLASIHGRRGRAFLGQLTFDDLVKRPLPDLVKFIREGQSSRTPLPELTGKHLLAAIYYIKILSLEGMERVIDIGEIQRGLAALGLYPNGAQAPAILNARVEQLDGTTAKIVWETDEPTIHKLFYGPTKNFGLGTPIEPGYTVRHEATLPYLTPGKSYHAQIRSKDVAGNLALYDLTFTVEANER